MDMIAIPTIGASPYAVDLYRTIERSFQHGPYHVFIMANRNWNGVRQQVAEARCESLFHVERTDGLNISEQWALAHRRARAMGLARIHVLNDDVQLHPASIPAMELAMRSDFRVGMAGYDYRSPVDRCGFDGFFYVSGTYRLGGVGGFAFCVQTDMPEPDPQFEWWGGDDDWVWSVEAQGKRVAIARGVPVAHPAPETSAITRPELEAAKGRDHGRLLAKWGRSW